MPGGDGTGPWGMGPLTGRRAGFCSGYPMPGFANPEVPRMGMGGGWRRGFGRGRGFRRGYGQAYGREDLYDPYWVPSRRRYRYRW